VVNDESQFVFNVLSVGSKARETKTGSERFVDRSIAVTLPSSKDTMSNPFCLS
jgi:hypothetical protein